MTALPSAPAVANPLRYTVAFTLIVAAPLLLTLVHPIAAVPAAAGALAAFRTSPYQGRFSWYSDWWPTWLGYTLLGLAGVGLVYLLVWAFVAVVWFLVAACVISALVMLKRIF